MDRLGPHGLFQRLPALGLRRSEDRVPLRDDEAGGTHAVPRQRAERLYVPLTEAAMLPSLFISHGSPMLALRPSSARDFLAGLGAQLPRPKAIVIASGHWETEQPEVNAVTVNDTIYDFYGFPPALYAIRYPAPGSPKLAERIAGLLRNDGLSVEIDHQRGLDHGAWVPMTLMYPHHDIPVLQLALQSERGPPHHL